MTAPDLEYLQKQCERSITKMSDAEALEHIALLIDASFEASLERGVKRAMTLLDTLSQRDLTDTDGALIEYFRANAWAALSSIGNVRRSWSWEAPERQEELLALSRAANHAGFASLDKVRRCQILTNQANLLNTVGRTIEAIAVWDAALKIVPGFAMARGNRGNGLRYYAGMMPSDRERAILALHAVDSLRSAVAEDALHESVDPRAAMAYFTNLATQLAAAVDIDAVRAMQNLDHGDEGQSEIERTYRRWCLEHRLFLCPLNDLGAHLAAATDDLMLPPIIESMDDRPHGHLPPPIVGFFSQMKQEYVSARFMLFEGMSSTQVHFSDRGVMLTDTLDYPLYSLASERVRTAFRIAYSLLDKVAFLVHCYWKLDKDPTKISFKNVWMVEGKKVLLPQLEQRRNLPLRGLFWLSKELFDDQLKQTTAADARELHRIRNALEHAYLRVNEGWAKPFLIDGASNAGLGITIGSDELEAKAIRVMQMARSALLYVSLAIGVEEQQKHLAIPGRLIGSMPLHHLDEERKRRDPC
ncbi:LA2681 family HEPN domain-containing protein [Stenotrophomonas maltophilia]|uniref:LA2681 family HEPN domain-containing protein n=1 Tax=Stenotrophomonas maltophilia TaxID=40324 RepID=UPI00209B7BD5|nr:LA2681 family HEPN domain-containing protein [Stenotrophomonas maltophilia]MCO7486989.1 LA2681 family HEPN domain-containing protein [Stenotrophomonas maltophilia]